MGRLIYAALTSLDGFTEDGSGNFGWAEPQEDLHSYVNHLESENSALLLGRKMYEILSFWEKVPDLARQPGYIQDYQAAWAKERKIVYSRTLERVATRNTTLKRDIKQGEIEEMKIRERGNIGIGGADLASQAFNLGLVDEVYQFMFPVLVGSGKKWLTSSTQKKLRLMESKVFKDDVVMVHYTVENQE